MNYFTASKRQALLQLMRIDKPIGTLLLLWPTLWALWIAAKGLPNLEILIVFCLGVFLMRSAGCVINDFADRKVDGFVARTKNRPLPSGRATSKEAIILFLGLSLSSFFLVLTQNILTIQLSFIGLLLAFIYTWTVAYDTMYGMVDKEDDLKIGIKSTAILFGEYDKIIIGLLQISTLILLLSIGKLENLGWLYYLSLIIVGILFLRQQKQIKDRNTDACFNAFLDNNYVGLVVFSGLFLTYF